MGRIDDDEPSLPNFTSPRKRSLFGKKLPLGRTLADIRAPRIQVIKDADLRRAQDDNDFRFGLIGAELQAFLDALKRAGIIDTSGNPTSEGQGPGSDDSGSGGGGGPGGGGWDKPPWWDQFVAYLQWFLSRIWIIRKLIEIVMENKHNQGGAAGAMAGTTFMQDRFDHGHFGGDFILDLAGYPSFTIPGTIINGELPPASDMWQNRIYGDLTNNRKIHVAASHGDVSNFMCVNPLGWYYSSSKNLFYPLDPGSLAAIVGIGVDGSETGLMGKLYVKAGSAATAYPIFLKGSATVHPTVVFEGSAAGTGQRWEVLFDSSAGLLGEFIIAQGGHEKLRIASHATADGDAYFGNVADQTNLHIFGDLDMEGNDITDVATVDGVDVADLASDFSTHILSASEHGAVAPDTLAVKTGAPVSGNIAEFDASARLADSGKTVDDFLEDVVDDTSPTLGGDLDCDGYVLTDSDDGEVEIDDDARVTGHLVVEDGNPGSPYFSVDATGFVVDGTPVDMEGASSLKVPAKGGLLRSDASTGLVAPISETLVAGEHYWLRCVAGTSVVWVYPEFFDDDFALKDNVDATKRLVYQLSSIATATTRTHTPPDHDFSAAMHPYIGASAPTAADGKLWYDTDLGEWFFYDNTRSKWLAVNECSGYFGSELTTHGNVPIKMIRGILPGTSPYTGEWMRWDATISGAWIALMANASATMTYYLYASGVNVGTLGTIGSGARLLNVNNLNINVSSGDYVAIIQYNASAATTNQPHARLFFRRRNA